MRLTIPNQLTLLRIILTPLFIFLILNGNRSDQLTASVVFTIASLTDWYDGWYARKFGVISRIGQFLDPLADKVLVTSALICFAYLNYVISWMVWVIVIRDTIITANRILALRVGTPIITHVLAKWKTAAQMVTIFLILLYMNWRNYTPGLTGDYSPQYFDIIGIPMLIVTALTILSGGIYAMENRELIIDIWRKLLRLS